MGKRLYRIQSKDIKDKSLLLKDIVGDVVTKDNRVFRGKFLSCQNNAFAIENSLRKIISFEISAVEEFVYDTEASW
jgi:hypothetical protein